MEIQTIQKYIHTSPRKLRLVADMVRNMEPNKALDLLRITQKDAAADLVKALETVMANAKVAGLDLTKVGFKKLEVDESMVLRRYHAGTRGRVKPYKKRMSHIKIVLTDQKTQNNSENQKVRKSDKSENSGTQSPSESSEKKKGGK